MAGGLHPPLGDARDLKRRRPPLAAGAGERLHADRAAVAAALLDQRRQRHREDALTREAITAHAMARGRRASRACRARSERRQEKASASRRQAATSCSLFKTSICKAVSAGSRTSKQVPYP